MNQSRFSVRSLCISAVIAALYVVLTLPFAIISYGAIQCRVSEALTILPVLLPEAIPGVVVGCLIANLFGSATVWDVVFGTLATLIAAIGTRVFRKVTVTKWEIPWVSALCPVIANGIIVGLVLHFTLPAPLFITMLEVAVGEVGALAIGIILLIALRKVDFQKVLG